MPLRPTIDRRRHRPRALLVAGAAVLALVVTGCTSDDAPPDDLTGPDLLGAAADEMSAVETVRLRVDADTDVAELPVREVDAQVTAAGDAAGTAHVDLLGQLVEVELVVVDDSFYYRLLGSWQEADRQDAADLYDPSAILDPERGVANLLRTASDPQIEATEQVDGTETYRVSAGLDPAAVEALLPGAPAGLTGTLWIGTDRALLHQMEFPLPDDGGVVSVRLSDFNEPADIRAP